jgi:hypothetical protein
VSSAPLSHRVLLAPAGATNGTAAREGGSGGFWDSISGAGHGDGGGSAPLTSTCLAPKRQEDSFCDFKANMVLADPIADDKPRYLFTQFFSDEALHPGVQVSDSLAYGHKHYTVTIEAADHVFHEKLSSPQTVYGYNGKYPGDSFEARQFEPIVVEVRPEALLPACFVRFTLTHRRRFLHLRARCVQWVNKLPDDHLFLIDPFIPHMPDNMGLDDVQTPPLNDGPNAAIAQPNGLRGSGQGSQGRAVVHLHGGCVHAHAHVCVRLCVCRRQC